MRDLRWQLMVSVSVSLSQQHLSDTHTHGHTHTYTCKQGRTRAHTHTLPHTHAHRSECPQVHSLASTFVSPLSAHLLASTLSRRTKTAACLDAARVKRRFKRRRSRPPVIPMSLLLLQGVRGGGLAQCVGVVGDGSGRWEVEGLWRAGGGGGRP